MAKNRGRVKHYASQFERTKKNKISRIEKELQRNPNNLSARKSLELWKTIGKREHNH